MNICEWVLPSLPHVELSAQKRNKCFLEVDIKRKSSITVQFVFCLYADRWNLNIWDNTACYILKLFHIKNLYMF